MTISASSAPLAERGHADTRGEAEGRLPGLLAMVAGALITETAITRVCPLNEAPGVDTARRVRLAERPQPRLPPAQLAGLVRRLLAALVAAHQVLRIVG